MAQGRIQSGGLASARKPGDDHHAERDGQVGAKLLQIGGFQPEFLERLPAFGVVEETNGEGLALVGRDDVDAHVYFLPLGGLRRGHPDAAVLRAGAFVRVAAGQALPLLDHGREAPEIE